MTISISVSVCRHVDVSAVGVECTSAGGGAAGVDGSGTDSVRTFVMVV